MPENHKEGTVLASSFPATKHPRDMTFEEYVEYLATEGVANFNRNVLADQERRHPLREKVLNSQKVAE